MRPMSDSMCSELSQLISWRIETYVVSCIMSTGQMSVSQGHGDGGAVGEGWMWVDGCEGLWRQHWEPQVCSIRRKRWQFAGPQGPWGMDQDLPWLPASQLMAAGWWASPAAPPTTTTAIKNLAQLQAGAQQPSHLTLRDQDTCKLTSWGTSCSLLHFLDKLNLKGKTLFIRNKRCEWDG